jgi:3-hydroxyacyl-CoA dehydrogenase
VVAAIHGTALGGGLEVAIGAHYCVALASARLGFPEVQLGLIPGAGGTQRAPRLMDAAKALDLIASGKPIPAAAACQAGLFDKVVDGADPAAAGEAYARELLAAGTLLRRSRELAAGTLLRRSRELPVRTGDEDALRRKLGDLAGPRSLDAVKAAGKAVAAALQMSFAQGLAEERRIFEGLMQGAQSRALRYMFFAEREAGKLVGVDGSAGPRPIAKVGVLGAGTMGSGIAMCFLNAGIPVTLVEVKQEALDRGVATIRKTYEALVAKGRLDPAQADATVGLLNPTLEFTALGEADLVIEAAFESMPVKQDIFARLSAIAKPGALMTSNTSFLDIDEIAAATKGREGAVKLMQTALRGHNSPRNGRSLRPRFLSTGPRRPSGAACRSGDQGGGVRIQNGCGEKHVVRRTFVAPSSAEI